MFNSTRDCKRLLSNFKRSKPFRCICGCSRNPYLLKNDEQSCVNCKKKYSVTNGTIFHNVKFGLLKAMRIAEEEYQNNFTSKGKIISDKYNISKKTTINFLHKIRAEKDLVIEIMSFEPKKIKKISGKSDKEKKLEIFYKKHTSQ
jgi:hypothetical protein